MSNQSEIESVKSDEIIKDEKDKKCAPNLKFIDNSCIPLSQLVEMAKAYNKNLSKSGKLIKLHPKIQTLNPSKYKKYLLKHFSYRFKNVCDNQRCWIEQKFVNNMNNENKNKLKNLTFRPKGPNGQFAWLSTLDINKVMKQYEQKYKTFKFIGAVPIDFDDLNFPVDFASAKLKEVMSEKFIYSDLYKKNKIDKIGVVFNLDEHYKSGSHWVGAFGDLKKGKIYYYDSYGTEPEERISKFLRRLARVSEKIGVDPDSIDARHNTTQHQRGGSECGVFSLNFILKMLNGYSLDDVMKSGITDSEVNKCREVYFI